ncbi:LamG-like jellyroll fold domain-containing protein, partial [Planctomycetota bacterium]
MCKKLVLLTSFVLVLGLVLTSTSKADLIGWWKLDDASGTTAVDSSGYDNHGTLGGNPQWVDGIIGGALELDGDDDYVAIDGIADEITENNLTVSAWIKTTMGGDGNVIGGNHGGSHDFIFGVSGSGTLMVECDSLNQYPPVINDGAWHHIAYVRDGSTAYAYTDGELVGTETPSGDPSAETRWSIGQEWDSDDSSSPSDEYEGLVDDVRFFNHPLTEREIKDIMVSEIPSASFPDPPDGTVLEATWASLTWMPGVFAVSHDVYLGENFDEVNDGTGDTFRGNQAFNFYTVGFPGFPYPDGLVPGTTYYWRIDEINDANPDSPWRGNVWSFSIPSKIAYVPSPADGAQYVPIDATLSWTAGYGAKLHSVYFGEDFDTVNDATGVPPQSATTYDPGPLAKNTTYYWRVDEFDGIATHKGDVWSFTTMIDIAITDPDLIGWWKFDEGSGDTAIDFSGHGNDGTLEGNAQWAEGLLGKAIDLPGGSHVVIDGVVDDITSTNISLSAWIKSIQGGQGDIFAANDSSSGHPLEFYIDGGYPGRYDGGDTTYTTAPFVGDGQWHLMTYVRDGSTAYIYVDGVQAVRDSASFSLSSVTRWSIGQEWDGTTPSNFYV